MLKYMVILTGVLVMLAATDQAQARGFRRSRGSCPNEQCPVSAPAAATKAATTSDAADAAATEVAASVTASTDAPRTSFRRLRGIRRFRRR